jgi:hypothetical protein
MRNWQAATAANASMHVALALCLALQVALLHAEEGNARLRMSALVEEGDLLLEESAGLAPIRQHSRAQAERLAASEKKLSEDVARVEKEVAAYNKAATELSTAAAEHTRACPADVADSAVVRCNERGARLMDQAAELDRKRMALEKVQTEVNARVDQHNRAREAMLAEQREYGPRLDANAADTQRWVSAARSFMLTPEFSALRERGGRPTACSQVRLADAGAHFGEQGLKQLHACLKAIQRGL